MATTTNYSWTTPDDTDLVSQGASAIRSLGTAIDTTVFTNAGNAIQKSIVDAKGDIIAATADNTVDRLAVGTNGQLLAANSSTATGLEWQTVSAGGLTLLSTTTLSGATTTISGISASYTHLMMQIYGVSNITANGAFRIAPNGTTNITFSVNTNNTTLTKVDNSYLFISQTGIDRTRTDNVWTVCINGYSDTNARKSFEVFGCHDATGASNNNNWGMIDTTSAISSLVFSNAGGNLSTGTVLLYGVK